MLFFERQYRIMEFVQQRPSVSVKELSQLFHVSPMTIRRDLEVLEEKGLVRRIHGGVAPTVTPIAKKEEERQIVNISQKSCIGEASLSFIEEGQTIFIDAGTTTIELVKRLLPCNGLTVVTNSVKVLSILAGAPGINLIGLGGAVYSGAHSFIGSLAEAAICRFHSNLAFLGITSLSLEQGLTEVNYFEAEIKALIIKQSQRVILLADSSKFQKVSPISVAPLTDIDVIITDDLLDPSVADAYRRSGLELILSPTSINRPDEAQYSLVETKAVS